MHATCGFIRCRQACEHLQGCAKGIEERNAGVETKHHCQVTQGLSQQEFKGRLLSHVGLSQRNFYLGHAPPLYASLFFSTYTCMPCCRPGVLPKARVVEVDGFPDRLNKCRHCPKFSCHGLATSLRRGGSGNDVESKYGRTVRC